MRTWSIAVTAFILFSANIANRAEAGPAPARRLGESCRVADDPNHFCLALKYVVYVDPSSHRPIVTEDQILQNLKVMNSIWRQCNIGFEIEDYLSVEASSRSLAFEIANYPELDDVRGSFSDDATLLIVTTGKWNRKGTLGDSEANAWTSMPGSGPYGAVMERTVGAFSNIIAHELGHYLGLSHSGSREDLMNPIIYSSSRNLTADQCRMARSAVNQYWQRMIR